MARRKRRKIRRINKTDNGVNGFKKREVIDRMFLKKGGSSTSLFVFLLIFVALDFTVKLLFLKRRGNMV